MDTVKSDKRKEPNKIGNAVDEIIVVLEKNDFNYAQIMSVLDVLKYEINRRCHIRK